MSQFRRPAGEAANRLAVPRRYEEVARQKQDVVRTCVCAWAVPSVSPGSLGRTRRDGRNVLAAVSYDWHDLFCLCTTHSALCTGSVWLTDWSGGGEGQEDKVAYRETAIALVPMCVGPAAAERGGQPSRNRIPLWVRWGCGRRPGGDVVAPPHGKLSKQAVSIRSLITARMDLCSVPSAPLPRTRGLIYPRFTRF